MMELKLLLQIIGVVLGLIYLYLEYKANICGMLCVLLIGSIDISITATLAFTEGELGWWGDTLYRSKVNGNVYTPETYAGNWEMVEE